MRVKCDALGIECEDYSSDQVVDDIEGLYTGLSEHLVIRANNRFCLQGRGSGIPESG